MALSGLVPQSCLQTAAVEEGGGSGVGGFRWGDWKVCGGVSLRDLPVSETRDINGFPPHIKGWINPNDWEGGGGVLRLGIGRGFLSPHLTAYLSGTGGEEKARRARVAQKVNLLLWLMSITPKFPDLKTQHSGGFVWVIFQRQFWFPLRPRWEK